MEGCSLSILHIEVLDDGEYGKDNQNSKYHIDYTGGLSIGIQRFGDWRRDCVTEKGEETKKDASIHCVRPSQ